MNKCSKKNFRIQLILLIFIAINYIECYYVLPLNTSYDYDPQETTDKAEIMHKYLTNNIYTELSIATPQQKLATLIKSTDYCSYIASNLCNIKDSNYDSEKSETFQPESEYNLEFKNFYDVCLAKELIQLSVNLTNTSDLQNVDLEKFYYAPNNSNIFETPYTCGVFGFRYKLDESIKGEDKCTNFLKGLNDSSDISFNELDNLVFSIEYSTEEKDGDIDGNLIIGNYPHEYDPDKYNNYSYKEIYINDTSSEDNKDFHTKFSEIYYFDNNEKISMKDLDKLNVVFILEQNMFSVPQRFYNQYAISIFMQEGNDCEEITIDSERYRTIVCEKVSDFTDETFPPIYFYHSELNKTFNFTRKELLVEKNGLFYFMLCVDTEATEEYWGLGKIFMEKNLLSFNYENNTIRLYYISEDKEEEKKKVEFDFLDNGIYVIIILGVNILVALSCALFAIIHKCTKSAVDPTIMIDSFSAQNLEELKDKSKERELL